jgi:serine/threonine protein kinase
MTRATSSINCHPWRGPAAEGADSWFKRHNSSSVASPPRNPATALAATNFCNKSAKAVAAWFIWPNRRNLFAAGRAQGHQAGHGHQEVIARFEAERQALALMDHPNIAKVLDAGATETGRPYFVMELVRGIKITDYCDQNNLSTVARLELFIQVCQAIQHAHQKGIIHRDIKPSNILVADQRRRARAQDH